MANCELMTMCCMGFRVPAREENIRSITKLQISGLFGKGDTGTGIGLTLSLMHSYLKGDIITEYYQITSYYYKKGADTNGRS